MTKDNLKPGMWYLISAPTAGTLVIKQGDVQVPVAYQAGQTPFYALGNEVEYGAGAVINGPFAKAPSLGIGGGGNLTPEEQGALTNLIGGTVAANGITLTFKLTSDQKKLVTLTGLDELNTGGAPINTLNGNVYHGSGSANFTETIGGQVYQTSIDAHHVECRWNGDLKVHLHADANGNAVLELNGERALTEAYDLRRMEQAALSTGTTASTAFFDSLRHTVVGDTLEYIFPNMTVGRLATSNGVFNLTEGVPSYISAGTTGAKVLRFSFASLPTENSHSYTVSASSAEFEFYGKGIRLHYKNRRGFALKAKRVTIVSLDTEPAQLLTFDAVLLNSINGFVLSTPVDVRLPFCTSFGASTFSVATAVARPSSGNSISNLTVSMPVMTSSFDFYASTTVDGEVRNAFKIHKDVLIHLWGSLPTASSGATITTSCDGADAHIDEAGDLVFDDASLAAAADAVQALGWTLNITPINQ